MRCEAAESSKLKAMDLRPTKLKSMALLDLAMDKAIELVIQPISYKRTFLLTCPVSAG